MFKESDVFAGVTEKVVLGKEVDRRFVIQRAGHDAPRNRVAHLCGQVLQALGLQLEQALVAGETDVEHALGTVETEAGTLTASDQKCGHLTLAEKNFASLFPEVVAQIVDCGLERHGLQVARNVVVQRGVGFFGIKGLQFFPVLAFDVTFQSLAGITVQRFKLGNQLLLTRRIQSFDNVHVLPNAEENHHAHDESEDADEVHAPHNL